jgi:hypothetical protein
MTIPAKMVGTKTGDCVVVGAASGEREVAAGTGDCAAVVSAGVGTVVGAAVVAVPFRAGAAVPATAVVAGGTVVGEAVVTEGVTEDVTAEVTAAVSVAVGTTDGEAGAIIAATGIVTARARSREQKKILFKEKCGVIRMHWMQEDMRIMERGTVDPLTGRQGTLRKKRKGTFPSHHPEARCVYL